MYLYWSSYIYGLGLLLFVQRKFDIFTMFHSHLLFIWGKLVKLSNSLIKILIPYMCMTWSITNSVIWPPNLIPLILKSSDQNLKIDESSVILNYNVYNNTILGHYITVSVTRYISTLNLSIHWIYSTKIKLKDNCFLFKMQNEIQSIKCM